MHRMREERTLGKSRQLLKARHVRLSTTLALENGVSL
jgi:hypothetical protein